MPQKGEGQKLKTAPSQSKLKDGLCEKEASWFNEYQSVDDFLFHHLGAEFPTNHDSASKNTIEAICRLAGLRT